MDGLCGLGPAGDLVVVIHVVHNVDGTEFLVCT
jgi:hypothetical protein